MAAVLLRSAQAAAVGMGILRTLVLLFCSLALVVVTGLMPIRIGAHSRFERVGSIALSQERRGKRTGSTMLGSSSPRRMHWWDASSLPSQPSPRAADFCVRPRNGFKTVLPLRLT